MKKLDKFLINNFKIFEGRNWFSFSELNILTGANNSGKSTIIKFIKLISEGFRYSDFPAIDLEKGIENLGDFNQIVNKNSKEKKIGFGLQTNISNFDTPFTIEYTFQEGRYSGMVVFLSLEIKDSKGIVFIGIYDHYRYWDGERNSPLKSPYTGSDDTSMLNAKINIKLLKKYVEKLSNNESIDYDFSKILDYLANTFSDYWWFETFREYIYEDDVDYKNTTYDKKFNDFLEDLKEDFYSNLADDNLKEEIHDDKDNDAVIKYNNITKETCYILFIEKVLKPIFSEIRSQINLILDDNLIYIINDDCLQKRFIENKPETEFLLKLTRLLNIKENKFHFIEEGLYENHVHLYKILNIFGFDSLIDIRKHFNSGFTVDFIPLKIKKEKTETFPRGCTHVDCENDLKNKISVADLGKGSQTIFFIILKVLSIILLEKKKDDKANSEKKKKPDKIPPNKIILIEEPEVFLHPSWQSKLADFFVYCIKNFNIQFIIETHSVYLIQKLQLLTARKEIAPKQVNILYFNSQKEKEKYYKLNIREDGILKEDFGEGFYDESLNLTIDLLKIQNPN
ncbi:MAG: DUF3696 domain-containing protein [Bacteroidales bacterium]|nr:DUF3696 domain-containing protein [Bacteroidales bacterium]